jgi:uncharacterized coiled-coil protein SlyX
MADDSKDFVHERFRFMDAKLDRLLASSEATTVRLASIERRLTSLEGSVVEGHERMDGMQRQLDSFGRRLERIERRLELSDAPHG